MEHGRDHHVDGTAPFGAVTEALRAAGCVFAENEARVLLGVATTPEELERLVSRRVGGMPLEQVVGWASFLGLRVGVAPGVFVPRRRTELLAREAAALARPRSVVVDLCCGSGAIGLAVTAAISDVDLWAVDIDEAAVRCARGNLPAAAQVRRGDLFDALPSTLRGVVDLLAVNAPYVPTGSIDHLPREARLHEPAVALDGGPDGLDVQRRVLAVARAWLAPSGVVLMETSRQQVDTILGLMARAGLSTRVATSMRLQATIVVGQPYHGSARSRTPTDRAFRASGCRAGA